MGDELLDLCTSHLEKWGLVDYELGVWEEQIIDGKGRLRTINRHTEQAADIIPMTVLGQCRTLAEQLDSRSGSHPLTVPGPSTTATSGHPAAPPRRR